MLEFMSNRLEKLKSRLAAGEMILLDGAWGTQMQKAGLQLGDCPEEWNVSRPEDIKNIAREYFKAGADVSLTNTFGGNRYRLVRHGFADKMREFNLAGAKLSRDVADEFGGLVAASVGPTGEYVEPEGMLKSSEMYNAFHEQISALKEGGADAICIETMYVLEEALLAVQASRDLGMYTLACMTFDATPKGFQTMLGTSVDEATEALDKSGADVIGTNCGNGIADMVKIAKQMRKISKRPLLVKSNAGLPDMSSGSPVYKETPELMATHIKELKAVGVSIVGGCCGTTPEHIRAFRTAIKNGF
jgi:5-methyltetrahydrofolate--homocysteine methyltransferase